MYWRRRTRLLLVAAIGLLMSVGVVSPANADVTLQPVPYPTDTTNEAAWWSPMAQSGDYTFMAYDAPGSTSGVHQVAIARRTDSTGAYMSRVLRDSGGSPIEFGDDVGHNQPSLAIDGDGYIHIFFSMHNTGWRYYRSSAPLDPGSMVNAAPSMPDSAVHVTYPNLATAPNGDVWLIVRSDVSGVTVPACGASGRAGWLYRWSNAGNTWSRIGPFACTDGRAVYPDDVQVDGYGDVHIAFEWAHEPASGIRHEGSYLRYRPGTGAFSVANGTTVASPATTSTPGLIYQPMTAGEEYKPGVSPTGPALVSAKLALYQRGSSYIPTVAYRYRNGTEPDFIVKRARFAGSWVREVVYAGNYDTYAAIDTTHDGTTARVYYVKKAPGADRAFYAESAGSGWVEHPLATGVPVERLSVLMRATGTDVLYLASPHATATTGALTFGYNRR